MNTNRLAGIILTVVGVLIAGLSGLCIAAFASDQMTMGESPTWSIILLIGGIPFLFGAVLILGGVLALRNARRQDRAPKEPPR